MTVKVVSSTTSRPDRVRSSVASSALTSSKPSMGWKNDWLFCAFAVFAPKFQASTKLCAVSGLPSENYRPSRILMVQDWLSSVSIDSATSFSTLPSAV